MICSKPGQLAAKLQELRNTQPFTSPQCPKLPETKAAANYGPTQNDKRRLSQKEKEERDTNKFLRKRLAWCNQTGQKYDESEEQYTILPRALADADGNPHRAIGRRKRYTIPETMPFLSSLPWVPQVVIIDGMFSININPLRQP